MMHSLDFSRRSKVDNRISDYDRALIDQAIAAGRVQVIPRGVSAANEVGELPARRSITVRRTHNLTPFDALDRRIIATLDTGQSQARAAMSLGISLKTLARRIVRMRLAEAPKKIGRPKQDLQMDEILARRAQGQTNKQIGEALGLKLETVKKRIWMHNKREAAQ